MFGMLGAAFSIVGIFTGGQKSAELKAIEGLSSKVDAFRAETKSMLLEIKDNAEWNTCKTN